MHQSNRVQSKTEMPAKILEGFWKENFSNSNVLMLNPNVFLFICLYIFQLRPGTTTYLWWVKVLNNDIQMY